MGNIFSSGSLESRADDMFRRKSDLNSRQDALNKNKSFLNANTETLRANVGQKIVSIEDQQAPAKREIDKANQLLQKLYEIQRK